MKYFELIIHEIYMGNPQGVSERIVTKDLNELIGFLNLRKKGEEDV